MEASDNICMSTSSNKKDYVWINHSFVLELDHLKQWKIMTKKDQIAKLTYNNIQKTNIKLNYYYENKLTTTTCFVFKFSFCYI